LRDYIGKQITEEMSLCRTIALAANDGEMAIPAKFYESIWVGRNTTHKYIREEGMPHDYR